MRAFPLQKEARMLYFIVNPASGGEKGFERWRQAERKLEKLGIKYDVRITDKAGSATCIARDICANTDIPATIVAVGGDGTFNEVINGLDLSDDITVGYIPTGSGNDLARELGLSKNPTTALDTVLECRNIRRIDYGVMTYGAPDVVNRRFAVSCGIGYDAAVCEVLQKSSLTRVLSPVGMQKVAYTGLGAMQMLKSKPSRGYILLDGTRKIEFKDILFVAVHNGKTEGGGYRFAPQASADDGFLSIGLVHTNNIMQFVKILAHAKSGNHIKYSGVRTFDCKNVKIHVDDPMYTHTDGEIIGLQNDIEVHCVESKLKIIV